LTYSLAQEQIQEKWEVGFHQGRRKKGRRAKEVENKYKSGYVMEFMLGKQRSVIKGRGIF
jgi:hypothetical protein